MNGIPSKRTDMFVETRIDDEVVLMQLEWGEFLSLKDTAGAIWEAIDGKRDIPAITEFLANRYERSATMIETDVAEFVGELVSAQLVALQP